jgi:hypothetical protein
MRNLLIGAALVVLWACSTGGASEKSDGGGSGASGGSSGGSIGISGSGGTGTIIGGTGPIGGCSADCTDFPAEPIFESGAASDAPTRFGDPAAGGPGACVVEPPDGAMIPRNWWRPRIRFEPLAGENLFEIRLHSAIEANDLVAYTTTPSWTVPEAIWKAFAANAGGGALTITVRGLATGGTPSRSQVTLNLAPVEAGGAMVYWATNSVEELVTASKLVGFKVGEEGSVDALKVADSKETGLFDELGMPKPARGGAAAGSASCIGCHTSTPDGKAVAFNDGWPWAGIMASVEAATVGARPTYVTDLGARAIQQPFTGTYTFSKAHWSETVRLAVGVTSDPSTSFGWTGANRNIVTASELTWFDLTAAGTVPADGSGVDAAVKAAQSTAWGYIARTGDTRAAVMPDWSHDGETIAYTSAEQIAGGHVGGITKADGITPLTTPTETDIYTVPFNAKAGGTATPLPGASEAGIAEYYPDFSADDAFVAFNRVATTIGYFYYRADGEIYVVPSAGGSALRLKANDPSTCSADAQVSPGVINSWPKWSPIVNTDAAGNKYYFLVFSSARKYPEQFTLPPNMYTPVGLDSRSSQLYLATIVVDPSGAITDYPAVYLWNQSHETSNLTPAWDDFQIPPAVVK